MLYRVRDERVEVMIAHMGGPFWARKDDGAWSIVKGEYGENDEPYAAARREFEEETGAPPPRGARLELGEVRQPGGKLIVAWAIESDFDPSHLESNMFTLEWPPGSGIQREFPEIDRADWFELDGARRKLLEAQHPFIDRLEAALSGR